MGNGDKSSLIGILSVVVALVAAALLAAGIAAAVDGDYARSIVIGYVAVAFSAFAIVLGAIAVITGRGRGWGAAGAVLGVLANPLVLQWSLEYVGGLG